PEKKAANGKESILLVEDEKDLLEMITIMLEQFGYRVFPAIAPTEAIHIAKSSSIKIDLLITDVIMPGMSGRDLADMICIISPTIKCLFMSGYTDDIISHHGVLDGSLEFIHKPFSMDELAAKVRYVIDGTKYP
ncbi:MAG: response regulator, partial [Desulfamplus sp.]|nr:response regulator [Desulfamplus sp.]